MKVKMKLDLSMVADEFDMISHDTRVFFNIETGEFDYLCDFMLNDGVTDAEKFDEEGWIRAPNHWDIDEYGIMVDFAEAVPNRRKSELLCDALDGKGAFRRFKDTLDRLGLDDEWYAFKKLAYIEIARQWCEEHGLDYTTQV